MLDLQAGELLASAIVGYFAHTNLADRPGHVLALGDQNIHLLQCRNDLSSGLPRFFAIAVLLDVETYLKSDHFFRGGSGTFDAGRAVHLGRESVPTLDAFEIGVLILTAPRGASDLLCRENLPASPHCGNAAAAPE